jgi:hypothetical protein
MESASVFNHQHVEMTKNEGIGDQDCATLFPHVELGYQRQGHTSDAMPERYADFRTESKLQSQDGKPIGPHDREFKQSGMKQNGRFPKPRKM